MEPHRLLVDLWKYYYETLMIVALIGGIGLFLLGMILLTDGLKSFAGDSLRRALLRFTGRPVTAFTSGVFVTALVQSSSATTLTTIGFVSAGLLSFNQAIGLMMGASLGTTSTGWLVAVFGFKFSISNFALPMICIGAFARLLGRGRIASLGLALAGFGLIFVGIEQLQVGMAGVTADFDFESISSSKLLGRLLMLLVGVILTVIMQSSSAAVATTLTALHAGAITFEQAALLVIGAAIGTTVTAGLAAVGASTAAQRTALAHILFNLFTGLVAVLVLPFFLWGLRLAQQHLGLPAGAVSLAAFHSAFILMGVLIFMPFIGPFSRMIEHILPERGPLLTRHLDPSLLTIPSVAMEAVRGCLRESAALLYALLQQRLQGNDSDRVMEAQAQQITAALQEVSEFIVQIPTVEHQQSGSHLRADSFHAIDHLTQLLAALSQQYPELDSPELAEAKHDCQQSLEAATIYLTSGASEAKVFPQVIKDNATALAAWRKSERLKLFETSAARRISAADSLQRLDSVRWIDRIAYHTWRITFYLKRE